MGRRPGPRVGSLLGSLVARAGAGVRRHPRWWGLLFAALLLGAYAGVLRPARVWGTAAVAAPLLTRVEAPAGRPHAVVPGESGLVLLAVPSGPVEPGGGAVAGWVTPGGVPFLLPALFLIAVFPARPLWLHLLGAHAALGLVTFAAFALGQRLGWTPAATSAYTFVGTYVVETVNLGLPVLLFLAGRARGGCNPPPAMVGSEPRVWETPRGHAIPHERDNE